VFDAPLSKLGDDGRIMPNLGGKRHVDPTFGEVAIPKLFYKIVACRQGQNDLAVAAFLMSQEEFLLTMDRLKGMPALKEEKLTEAEARLYQVRVADIAQLTGLDFGVLQQHDVASNESLQITQPVAIATLEDVRLVH